MEKFAERYGIKKEQAAGLGIVLALEIIVTIMTIVMIAGMLADPGEMLGNALVVLALCILTGYYTLIGYKKPHGNLLRYCMFAFAFLLVIEMVSFVNMSSQINMMLNLIAALLMAYMAGRLNKFDKNKYIIILILILLAFSVFISPMGSGSGVGKDALRGSLMGITIFVLWLALSFVYTVRYKDHKDAGEEK